jgi:hypothetical protein
MDSNPWQGGGDGTVRFVERTEEAQAKIVIAAASFGGADASSRSHMENIQR